MIRWTAGTDDIIQQYVRFCHVFDEQVRLYGRTKQTVEETIRICQGENILAGYLMERKKEVEDIMSILFSQEEVTERYGYERYIEGRNEERENTALDMLRDHMDIKKIMKYTKLSPERIAELAETLS